MTGFILETQATLFGERTAIGFGDESFYVSEIDRNIANDIIRRNHYSGKIYSGTYIHLGIHINGRLVGVLQYGYAMNPASGSSVVAGTAGEEYLELNRMWLSDEAPRNSESRAIAFSIRYIKKRFPRVQWIQSFADERCGRFGVVYQAANFKFYGEHLSTFWELDGVVYHNVIMTNGSDQSQAARNLRENRDRAIQHDLRQFRYIYYIDRRAIKRCLLKERPYPKHGETVDVEPVAG